jgi:hypothetical protein
MTVVKRAAESASRSAVRWVGSSAVRLVADSADDLVVRLVVRLERRLADQRAVVSAGKMVANWDFQMVEL